MAGYNTTRYVEQLLERTEVLPPSFTVHLHLEYWTLNNGSKFLYNNQIASLLDDVRAHRIPVDFLDLFEAAKVPFYDGCMIVELLDYRPQRNKVPTLDRPERTRAVLHPNSETLWADICSMNQRYGGKWTDRETLEIEARLLLATSPPLCLDPDPHLARIANHVMRVSTPTVPVSLKRKAAALDPQEDETDKARRAKIMQFMNPRQNRSVTPSYRILDVIQRKREKRDTGSELVAPTSVFAPSPAKPPTPSINVSQAHSPAELDDKKKLKAKGETPKMPFATTAFARANGSLTPVPQTITHQFISQNPPIPSPTPNAHSPMQPQVYPNVQAATEAARRTPTPAQIKNYAASPRPPSKTPAPPQNITSSQANAFQTQVPNAHFLNQLPARNAAPKGVPVNAGAKLAPQQQQQISQASLAQAQLIYAQQLQQGQQVQQQQANALLQQRLAAQKAGRLTPQAVGAQTAPSPAARNSPMATNKPLLARSPMPPTSQLPPQQQQGMQQHPAQHPQHTFTPTYNPAHLRPLVHANPQIPAHLAAAAAAASGRAQTPTATPAPDGSTQPQQQQQPQTQQQQQQPQQAQLHMYAPQMYGYPPMNYGQAQVQAHAQRLYWQQHGMGRGIPMVNGQPALPGMAGAAHAQQVAGKAGSAGIQGR